MCARASMCVMATLWVLNSNTSVNATAGEPVKVIICKTGAGIAAVLIGIGAPASGAGVKGSASETVRPVVACSAARTRTSSVMKFNAPSSSASPQRPQFVGTSPGVTICVVTTLILGDLHEEYAHGC